MSQEENYYQFRMVSINENIAEEVADALSGYLDEDLSALKLVCWPKEQAGHVAWSWDVCYQDETHPHDEDESGRTYWGFGGFPEGTKHPRALVFAYFYTALSDLAREGEENEES